MLTVLGVPRSRKRRHSSEAKAYTRECPVIHVNRLIHAQSVGAVMQKLIEQYGPSQYIRSDNGSVPRGETTTCEAIYRNAVADLARFHE